MPEVSDERPTLAELDAGEESIADTMRSVAEEMGITDEPPVREEPVEAEANGDGREPDEHGRFVAKPKEEAETADGGEVAEAVEASAEEVVEDEPLEPPHEWTAEQQAEFRKVPKALQQLVIDRVEAAREGIEASTKYQAMEQVLAPRRQDWARRGLDDVRAVNQVLSTWDWAAKEPEKFIHWFAAQTGFEIADDGPETPGAEGEADPRDQTISALQKRLDEWEAKTYAQEEQNKTQRMNALANEVREFAAATDDKGRPLRPYFNEVRPYMGAIMKAEPGLSLGDAYDRACYANPAVRDKIAGAQTAAAERERTRKEREHAAAARRAGSSITGSPGSGVAPQLTGNIKDDMTRVAQDMGLL